MSRRYQMAFKSPTSLEEQGTMMARVWLVRLRYVNAKKMMGRISCRCLMNVRLARGLLVPEKDRNMYIDVRDISLN
jgi:hypothetical protein